jgi:hypothetical protein
MRLQLPLFIREYLWTKAYKKLEPATLASGQDHGRKWLILYDEQDPAQTELALLLHNQHTPFPSLLLGYFKAKKYMEAVEGRVDYAELNLQLLPHEKQRSQVASDAFEFVIQLSPNPALPMRYLAALAPASHRIAVNLEENDDLYDLELKWSACEPALASQRFFAQLKTYFKNAV